MTSEEYDKKRAEIEYKAKLDKDKFLSSPEILDEIIQD